MLEKRRQYAGVFLCVRFIRFVIVITLERLTQRRFRTDLRLIFCYSDGETEFSKSSCDLPHVGRSTS